MNITIKTQNNEDGSKFITVTCSDEQSPLDHDKITELQALVHLKHKLVGGQTSNLGADLGDWQDVYVENATPEFEKDLMLWRMS